MKYIGLNPIGREPTIEIIQNGYLYDLHNCADFTGHQYDQVQNVLTLSWDFGCDCKGVKGGIISLILSKVTKVEIKEKNPDVPRSEDLCLDEMQELDDNTLSFFFRGGEEFIITCESVTFDPKETIGHKLKDK